jgi:K+-transporting ATPase ATPase B chain
MAIKEAPSPRPRQPGGPREQRRHTPKVNLSGLYQRAFREAFVKLNPRVMVKNPVMFVVWVGTIITLITTINPNIFGAVEGDNPYLFNGLITLILFFTRLGRLRDRSDEKSSI